MTQPTTPNATPGKSIYLDGFVLEGYEKSYSSYSYTNRISCPAPHPFLNGQEVVLGKDYVKQWQFRYDHNTWRNVVYDFYMAIKDESNRRIIALPIQNDNKEGESEYFEFNLNYTIKVKLRDAGIEHYVKNHNSIMPFEYHISFREYKSRADKDGFHTYQMHDFMNCFGGLGLSLSNMVDLNIIIPKSNLKTP